MSKIRMTDAYTLTPTLRSSNNPWRDMDGTHRGCGSRKRDIPQHSYGVNTYQPRVKKRKKVKVKSTTAPQIWGYIS